MLYKNHASSVSTARRSSPAAFSPAGVSRPQLAVHRHKHNVAVRANPFEDVINSLSVSLRRYSDLPAVNMGGVCHKEGDSATAMQLQVLQ